MLFNAMSTLLIIFLFYCFGSSAALKPAGDKLVVCYLRSWAIYRQTFTFKASDIDPSLCTHIVYLWARLSNSADDIVSNIPHIDLGDNAGNALYTKVTGLKQEYPHLKVLLTVGGSIEPSENFSRLSRNTRKRANFARNAVNFLRKYGFDGLDIYWFQNENNISDDDRNNFPLLLEAVKTEFSKNNLLLTTILSGSKSIIDKGYNIPAIINHIDWININTYYYHSPHDNGFGIHSPLLSNDDKNVKSTIDYYLSKGAPANKIVMRLSANGFGYKNVNLPGNVEAMKGLFTEDLGFLAYFEICEYLESDWTALWDSSSYTPIAVKDTNKISYDNERSMKFKGKHAIKKNLLGVAFSTLDVDDFSATCSYNATGYGGHKYPLLKALIRGLLERDNSTTKSEESTNENDVVISVVIDKYQL